MGAGRHDAFVADRTCTLMLETERGNMIRLRNSFISTRPDNSLYYSLQGTKGCFQAAQGPTDFHKIHIKGLRRQNEWRNIDDFSGLLDNKWKKLAVPQYDDISGYDSGTPLMLEAFANSILQGTKPPISAADAMNWTVSGLLSEQSITQGSVAINVPVYQ